jgi:hypothetical protein
MSAPRAFLSLAVAATLAGCSTFDPYPTFPREPASGAHDRGPRVAVCYNLLVSSAAAVRKEAQSECAAETAATRVDTDWRLEYCPLLLPARATFVCTPKAKK